MRTHRTHQIIAPWSTGAPVLDPQRLAVLRVEPVSRQRKSALLLDLCLADGDALTVIPGVLVEPALVVGRERDPLVWPHGTPGDDAFLAALAERVLPHLERLVLSGERIEEHVVTYADAPAFFAARGAGALGAAPLRDALVQLAPYRYATRFARARRVRLDAAHAVGGWALLRERGTVGVAAARRDPALCAWYGTPPEPPANAEVAIVARDGEPPEPEAIVVRLDVDGPGRVDVVDPFPLDVAITFDPREGPVAGWFRVERAPEPRLRAGTAAQARPVGGSAGRIALILGREDGLARPSADTDEALALAAALRAEGFAADLVAAAEELAGADLIHLIGTREGRFAREIVERGRAAGIPVAVHAHYEDARAGGWWGVGAARFCFEYGSDERDVARYTDLLARRALVLDGITAQGPYAPAEAAPDGAAAALRDAAVVYASSALEEEAIRRLGRRGPIVVVPPLASRPFAPGAIGARTGPDPFVLVHAPIGPEHNQLLVARACAEATVPLVCAGPVVDASYLERVREFGGPDLTVLPEPSAEEAAALRAAAAVVVDAAWVGEGGARLAAAALAGARLAIADRRPYGVPGAARFDPGDLVAMTRAIGEAWDAALRGGSVIEQAAEIEPSAVVRAIVRGYAALAAPVP
ncbi:MAG TPA: hypothetical protein VMA36_16870 [Candidatus Limnocylindria bacterium]|nr:hypothetical protein [Candidatus Limnocylindria bacterium]